MIKNFLRFNFWIDIFYYQTIEIMFFNKLIAMIDRLKKEIQLLLEIYTTFTIPFCGVMSMIKI